MDFEWLSGCVKVGAGLFVSKAVLPATDTSPRPRRQCGAHTSSVRRSDTRAISRISQLSLSREPFTLTTAHMNCRSEQSVPLCICSGSVDAVLVMLKHNTAQHPEDRPPVQLTPFLPMQQISWFVC